MNIDVDSGVIEFTREIVLRRGMTRRDILALDIEWQEWTVIKNVPSAFRAIINLPNKGITSKTILIVRVGEDNRPLTSWDVAPWDLTEGKQSRPEGKSTKRMRSWFKDTFEIGLPLKRDWGHVDASYDPWNQSTGVICNYREAFSSEMEWSEYKINNAY